MSNNNQTVRPSSDIARRLRAGETLTAAQVAEEYGVTTSLLGAVIKNLRNEGVTILATPAPEGGGKKQYQLNTMLPSKPDEWGKGPNVQRMAMSAKQRAQHTQRVQRALPSKPPKPPKPPKPKQVKVGHPTPQLGGDVQVHLLMVSDDGVVTVGLRNGEHSWTANIDGYARRPVESESGPPY